MPEDFPSDIRRDLDRAAALHDRAAADYSQCQEFHRLVSDLVERLEDTGHLRAADKLMGLLVDCNPKDGARCDASERIGRKIKRM